MDKLYDEAVAYFQQDRILFRGFLIEKKNGATSIQDIRNPYYKPVTDQDLKVLMSMGFRKGATYLLMQSDIRKIERYIQLTEQQIEASGKTTNPRKKQEYKNSIERYRLEIEYYESQVRRWQKFT